MNPYSQNPTLGASPAPDIDESPWFDPPVIAKEEKPAEREVTAEARPQTTTGVRQPR